MTLQVTATSLNLRDAPNGNRLAALIRGTTLKLLGRQDAWAQVATPDGQVGWVSAEFIADSADTATTAPAAMPTADDPQHPVTVAGQNAMSPDGKIFARRSGRGWANLGETSVAAWVANQPTPPAGVSPSALRILQAMSVNEGALEAINSYDDCHMSFGMLQWTAGPGADPGELAVLLARLKAADPNAHQDLFGRYGLQPQVSGPSATTGRLALSDRTLATDADKDVLRQPEWAYRFWRAGHHPSVRAAQMSLAADRIGRFKDLACASHPVCSWMSSEYGIALILDEHVNRPGHVPKTLAAAIDALKLPPEKADPAGWTAADEASLVDAYLSARAKTNMTDSQKRALRIGEAVRGGRLSDQRGSFAA